MRLLDRLEEILIATLIAAATLLIFVSVAQRYSLDFTASTMPGSERSPGVAAIVPPRRSIGKVLNSSDDPTARHQVSKK